MVSPLEMPKGVQSCDVKVLEVIGSASANASVNDDVRWMLTGGHAVEWDGWE